MNSVNDLCALIQEHVAPMLAQDPVPGQPGRTVEADTPLLASGLLDSMTVVSLVVSLERECAIEIPEQAIMAANFRTPDQLWQLVSQLRGAGR